VITIAAVAELSRNNCLTICAILVPLNLLLTIVLWVMVIIPRRKMEVLLLAAIANICSLALISHVASWWIVGIFLPASLVLLILAAICLSLNLTSLWFGRQIRYLELIRP